MLHALEHSLLSSASTGLTLRRVSPASKVPAVVAFQVKRWRSSYRWARSVSVRCCVSQAGSQASSTNGSSPQQVRWLSDASDPVASNYDAIVVLAGGFTATGGLPEWVTRRLDASQDIFSSQGGAKCPILCLGGGTPHKPPILSPTGHVVHESTACADYLMSRGVPRSCMLKEVSSYDTVGNGYFALTIHAIPSGWRRLSIITSDFHMPRSRAIFEHSFRCAGRAFWQDPDWFSLDYHAVHDEELFPPDVLQARIQREQHSLQGWQRTCKRVQTLPQLHDWLHTEHLCYAAARQHEFGRGPAADDIDDKALATY